MRRTRPEPTSERTPQRSDRLAIDPYAIEDTAFTLSEIRRAREAA